MRHACPVTAFQKLISGKYKLRIVWDLQDGPLRYSEIRTGLLRGSYGTKEIAPRVLSRELKALTESGLIDRKDFVAGSGDLLRLPMGIPHGLFNKSDQPIKCLFWVTPTRKLYDLFWAIHSMKEQNPPDVVALSAKHEVNFLPPPPGA